MSVKVFTGCMGAGKTTKLLKAIEQAKEENKEVLCLKHCIDTRYKSDEIVSHTGKSVPATPVSVLDGSLLDGSEQCVFIDEAQFFSGLIEFVDLAVEKGKVVYVAGLDMDCLAKPFGEVLELSKKYPATFLTGKCISCENPATHTMLIQNESIGEDSVLVGGMDKFKPCCESCFRLPQTETE